MTMSEMSELRKEISVKRHELHKSVDNDVERLRNQEVYELSIELDNLIVKVMKKELEEKNY